MTDSVVFGGFRQWLPLDLDVEATSQAARIAALYADDGTPPDVREHISHLLATVAVQARESGAPGTAVICSWALLDDDGQRLAPITFAFARLVRVDPGTTFDQVIEQLTTGVTLYQPIDVADLDTPLGQAKRVRVRTYVETDQGLLIREAITVAWMLSVDGPALLLQTHPLDDLVLAGDVSRAVTELAQTVEGR